MFTDRYIINVGSLPWQQDAKPLSQSELYPLTQETSNNVSMAITSKCNDNKFSILNSSINCVINFFSKGFLQK